MSNFHFGNTNYDYLNQNTCFNFPVSGGDNQMGRLVTEYHTRQTLLLNNLKKELEQNDQIKKNDMALILQKHDNNKAVIYKKYGQLLNNLFLRLKQKANSTHIV